MFIKTNAKTLRGLLGVAATDDVRYYLNGIYADTTQRTLVATNGHAMVIVRPDAFELADDGADKPVILPRAMIEAVIKGVAPNAEVWITNIDLSAPVKGQWRTFPYKAIDGRYPDYQRVIPAWSGMADSEIGQFNADYLRNVAKALHACRADNDKNDSLTPTITHNGPNMAAIVTQHNVENAFGVLMPFRADTVSNALWSELSAPAHVATKEAA